MEEQIWGTLEIAIPGKAKSAFKIARSMINIGSDERNDITLSGPGISQFHCKIVCNEDGCEIIDLRSDAGVTVNHRPVIFRKLISGDIITLGSVSMMFNQAAAHEVRPSREAPRPESGQKPALESLPYVRIHSGAPGATIQIEPGKVITFGTDKNCDVVLPYGKKVFPRHASIEWKANSRVLTKLYELASVFVNDSEVRQYQVLYDENIIRIGDIVLEYGDPTQKRNPATDTKLKEHSAHLATKSHLTQKITTPIPEYILKKESVTIGRDPANNIVLPHEMVSRMNSKIEYRNNTYHIVDLHSTNGTFLNGMRIQDSILTAGDLIQVGDFEFHFDGKSLNQASREGETRIDAIRLTRKISEDALILNDISLSIYPRELVAIVGGSGAGKSTLMNALAGLSPADAGSVLVNGIDFYKYFDAFRSSLGYVPQDDIIHKELSVYKAFYYAACLRMPEDTRKAEREARIQQILGDLQLSHRRDTPISALSGGERKRVSIGVELLTRPRLFFLDEPTSGLDPGLEAEMMNIFRNLANQGHTTILITHATKNLDLCDQVLFLARGGHLAYYGPPGDAYRYFNAGDFSDIYVKLEKEKKAEQWVRQYKNSVEYKAYVEDRIQESRAQEKIEEAPPSGETRDKRKKSGGARASMLRQFFLLSSRYIEIIVRDTRNFAILLLQAPLIGILLSFVYGRDIFDKSIGKYPDAKSLLFFLICICIWFGTSNAAREIAKEIPIYRRERFINLGIAPYIFSKVAVLSLLCVVQTLVLFGIIVAKVKFPELGFVMYRKFFLAMLLTSICSMAMGLMISAIVSNPDKAASIVPILLIPQIVFSGAIIPLKGAAEFISYFTLSRWGFELLGSITQVTKVPLTDLADIPKNSFPMFKDHTTEGIFNIISSTHWAILLGYLALFILIACLFQKLKDYSRVR